MQYFFHFLLLDLDAIIARGNKKKSSAPLQSTPTSSKSDCVASGNFSSSGESSGNDELSFPI